MDGLSSSPISPQGMLGGVGGHLCLGRGKGTAVGLSRRGRRPSEDLKGEEDTVWYLIGSDVMLRYMMGSVLDGFGIRPVQYQMGSVLDGFGIRWVRYQMGSVSDGFGIRWVQYQMGSVLDGFDIRWVRYKMGSVSDGSGIRWVRYQMGSVSDGFGIRCSVADPHRKNADADPGKISMRMRIHALTELWRAK